MKTEPEQTAGFFGNHVTAFVSAVESGVATKTKKPGHSETFRPRVKLRQNMVSSTRPGLWVRPHSNRHFATNGKRGFRLGVLGFARCLTKT
ncbi:hypothetical protein RRG08_004929 [Elysia crispata]|uniref:Uncharacterized protein n=1 Tax=Elysia crispata TaxID=231223 RepID=A0AAE0ZJK2_9GAST|nr:hypothetical protein RRG08_004929 [Elysia crispata]